MMKETQKADCSGSSFRVRFPDEEVSLPWLSMLLDACAIIDEGVAVAVRAEEDDVNAKLACREGCDNCCRTHRDIPIYPLEIIGISWFVTEHCTGPLRATLMEQLSAHGEEDPCPFLIHRSCSIHLLRPIACRQFNVFHDPCDVGEDPFFSRREDVLTPLREYTHCAFSVMLPFYGAEGAAVKAGTVENIIRTQVLNLQSFDWKELVKIMVEFDSKRA